MSLLLLLIKDYSFCPGCSVRTRSLSLIILSAESQLSCFKGIQTVLRKGLYDEKQKSNSP